MAAGIRAELVVDGIEGCPATAISRTHPVDSVVTDRRPTADGGVVGELTLTHEPGSDPAPAGADRVFADGSQSVYRFTTDEADCPCGRIPDHGCPVRDLRAEGGSLVCSFLAPDTETVREIVSDLRSCSETVRLRRLTRSAPDDQQALLVVDRSAFTDRQYEVLQTAHEMGYFDSPKRAGGDAVAERLEISVATFSEHLAVAQRKLLDQLLAD